jgi:epoxyqueuosine reductase
MAALAGYSNTDLFDLARKIRRWALELGFQQVGITDTDLSDHEARLLGWLHAGRHGEMGYMAHHGTRRSRPEQLVPGTIRVISARMDYWPAETDDAGAVLNDPRLGYVSRYALGRDYHKLIRQRLQRLADRI